MRRCGMSRELMDMEFETHVAHATDGHGFTDLDHTLEVFGVCPVCQR